MGFRFRFVFLFWFLVLGSGFAAAQPRPHNPLHLQASPGHERSRASACSLFPLKTRTREPRILWIGEASAVLLADDLNAFGKRAYTREERLDAFEQLQVPPVATLSHATVIRLGQVVGATHVVIGSFRLTGGMISVRAQNIRLDTGRMEHEFVEAGPLDDLFAIFERVSRRLAGQSASDAAAAAAGAAGVRELRQRAHRDVDAGENRLSRGGHQARSRVRSRATRAVERAVRRRRTDRRRW